MCAMRFIRHNGIFESILKHSKITDGPCMAANNSFFSGKCLQHPLLLDVINKWRHDFEAAQVSEPRESIEYIVAHVLAHKNISEIHKKPNQHLSTAQHKIIEKLCLCRLAQMPVQYIIGEWDFRDLTLKMIPPVFIPRPETELLVDIVIRDIVSNHKKPSAMLEIGCGSGAITLALMKAFPKLKATAVDQSLLACRLTQKNAELLELSQHLTLFQAKLTEENLLNNILGNQYEFIVSNPPYVLTGDLLKLQPEVKLYEDLRALDGGKDGLNVIKPLLKLSSKKLVSQGYLYLEVDPSHPNLISKWLHSNRDLDLSVIKVYKDYNKNDRFVKIQKNK